MSAPDAADALLARAAAGDGAALGGLLEYHRPYLELMARARLGPRLRGKADPADVVQEAFLAAHRDFPGFRGASAGEFAAWLRAVLAHALANHVRHYRGTQARDVRLERQLADDLDRSSAALGAALAAPHSTPSERAARHEDAVRLAAALATLPPDYREVLTLRYLDGLTFPQASARMGRSLDSVEKLWVRALGKLRHAMRADP